MSGFAKPDIEMTNLKSDLYFWVEICPVCGKGASIQRIIEEWGVSGWTDGVRRWNRRRTLSCWCSKCGRRLEFKEKS